jgi:hypothetical protein
VWTASSPAAERAVGPAVVSDRTNSLGLAVDDDRHMLNDVAYFFFLALFPALLFVVPGELLSDPSHHGSFTISSSRSPKTTTAGC